MVELSDSTPIGSVGFTTRTMNVLRREGVQTIGQLRAVPVELLRNWWGFGEMCQTEVRKFLSQPPTPEPLPKSEPKSTSCRSCKFCGYYRSELKQCRRYPPKVYPKVFNDHVESIPLWPPVKEDDDCGEFKRLEMEL